MTAKSTAALVRWYCPPSTTLADLFALGLGGHGHDQRNLGGRFSMNARMPSLPSSDVHADLERFVLRERGARRCEQHRAGCKCRHHPFHVVSPLFWFAGWRSVSSRCRRRLL